MIQWALIKVASERELSMIQFAKERNCWKENETVTCRNPDILSTKDFFRTTFKQIISFPIIAHSEFFKCDLFFLSIFYIILPGLKHKKRIASIEFSFKRRKIKVSCKRKWQPFHLLFLKNLNFKSFIPWALIYTQ